MAKKKVKKVEEEPLSPNIPEDAKEARVASALDALAGPRDESKIPTKERLVQECYLPSRGYWYGDRIPDGKVKIRPWGTDEEAMMDSSGDRSTLSDSLVRSVWVRPQIKYEDLLIGDKSYMLLFIRSISYGPEYTFNLQCRRCNQLHLKTMHLQEGLEVRALDEGDVEPFFCKLPLTGTEVGMRLLRVKDENAIRSYCKEAYQKSTDGKSPEHQYRLAMSIVSIDGEDVDIRVAHKFVREELIGMNSVVFRKCREDHDIGPRMRFDSECPRCGYHDKQDMPMTLEFFRPELTEV